MPVHLFGLAAEMEKINEIARADRLPVIEDAAPAIGARTMTNMWATSAPAAASASSLKKSGRRGDGGMITTSDPELADRIPCCATTAAAKSISTTCWA